MEEGFAQGFIEKLQLYGSTWLHDNLLGAGNLTQIAGVVGTLIAARLLAPRFAAIAGELARRRGPEGASGRMLETLPRLATAIQWLVLLWLAVAISLQAGWPHHLLRTAASLTSAWVVIRIASSTIHDEGWSRGVAVCAWTLAALGTLGLFGASLRLLDSLALSAGGTRVSVLTLIEGLVALAVLMWAAVVSADLIERRLQRAGKLSPSLQVLAAKSARVLLVVIAVVVALETVGIDLTALAVFSGALGVGIGFGLQRIFANLISGFILLMDRSIKPGDVVTVGDTYGWIEALGARYVSVRTRDGIEHLIPNEELIVQRVENWSHTDKAVRLRIPIGVSYDSDVHEVIALCVEAARRAPRVLDHPSPICLLSGFGDSSVDLELRIWIADPERGRGNVTSEVLLNVWDAFHSHGIEIPFPQRDLHLRSSDVDLGGGAARGPLSPGADDR